MLCTVWTLVFEMIPYLESGPNCSLKIRHSDVTVFMFVVSSVIVGWSLNWLAYVYVLQCLVVQTCPLSCGTSNRRTSVSRQCTDTTTMSAVWRLFPAETLSYLPRETSPSKFGRLPLGMLLFVWQHSQYESII